MAALTRAAASIAGSVARAVGLDPCKGKSTTAVTVVSCRTPIAWVVADEAEPWPSDLAEAIRGMAVTKT